MAKKKTELNEDDKKAVQELFLTTVSKFTAAELTSEDFDRIYTNSLNAILYLTKD